MCRSYGVVGMCRILAARELSAQGWREARITQVATGAAITRPSFRDCRTGADPETAARSRYVVYRYNIAGRAAHRIAPLLDELPLKVGDRVYVNIDNCFTPPVPTWELRSARGGAS